MLSLWQLCWAGQHGQQQHTKVHACVKLSSHPAQAWGGGAFCEEYANGLPADPVSCLVPYNNTVAQVAGNIDHGSGAISTGQPFAQGCKLQCVLPLSADGTPQVLEHSA